MTTRKYRRSEYVEHPPALLYQLVCDIDQYSSFLPWCSRSVVHSQQDRAPGKDVFATLEMSMGPISQSFTTRNRVNPEKEIEMTLVEGPFRHLHGLWRFMPEQGGCRIDLDIDFEFSNRFIDLTFGPLFRFACESLIGAFRRRADELGHSCLPHSTKPS